MKTIPGFKNYLITKDGQVYSQLSKKYLKPSLGNHGYLVVCLHQEGRRQTTEDGGQGAKY